MGLLTTKRTTTKKPPLGIEPKEVWLETRYKHLQQTIINFINEDYHIPLEWVKELNERSEAHLRLTEMTIPTTPITSEMKEYTIWQEGYQLQGKSVGAVLLGTVLAQTFKHACVKWAAKHSEHFSDKYLTIHGIRVHDNETDARKNFG